MMRASNTQVYFPLLRSRLRSWLQNTTRDQIEKPEPVRARPYETLVPCPANHLYKLASA